jgi:hypothetical protein
MFSNASLVTNDRLMSSALALAKRDLGILTEVTTVSDAVVRLYFLIVFIKHKHVFRGHDVFGRKGAHEGADIHQYH